MPRALGGECAYVRIASSTVYRILGTEYQVRLAGRIRSPKRGAWCVPNRAYLVLCTSYPVPRTVSYPLVPRLEPRARRTRAMESLRPRLERQIVIIQWWGVPGRRIAQGGLVARRRLSGRGASARRRGRIRAWRSVAWRPDHPFTAWPASLARLVSALEVGRARIALRRAIVPHLPPAHRAEGQAVRREARACDGRARGARGLGPSLRRRSRDRSAGRHGRGGGARRPDHAVALAVLALVVWCLGVPLPLAIVPHRALTFGTVRNDGSGVLWLWLGHLRRRGKDAGK